MTDELLLALKTVRSTMYNSGIWRKWYFHFGQFGETALGQTTNLATNQTCMPVYRSALLKLDFNNKKQCCRANNYICLNVCTLKILRRCVSDYTLSTYFTYCK